MKYVLLIYQGSTSLPGSDRWDALSAAEQKAIYTDYAEINKSAGVTPGLPLGLLRARGRRHGGGGGDGRAHSGRPPGRCGGDSPSRTVLVIHTRHSSS